MVPWGVSTAFTLFTPRSSTLTWIPVTGQFSITWSTKDSVALSVETTSSLQQTHHGAPGRGGSAQRGAGPRWVHGPVFGDIQGPVQIVHVHQRVQVLGLSRGQDVGFDAINFAQLKREHFIFYFKIKVTD